MAVDQQELQQWVVAQVAKKSSVIAPAELHLTALAGDAGFRQYFSVNSEPKLLAVMAPKTPGISESAGYFADLSASFRERGVETPLIVACDRERNYLLIEHFGNRALLEELSEDTADSLYGHALETLIKIQRIPKTQFQLPEYTENRLVDEMELFRQWFVTQMLGYELSAQENNLLDGVFSFLSQQAIAQPQVLVHRDYHSRNLMYRYEKPLGVIDFQDAVWGPVTYDLVSLLRDCYVRWSPDQVYAWVSDYRNTLINKGVISEVEEEYFIQWFDTMGLQRHLKVLGIFARLSLRDNKHGYLHDLPLVMRYTLEVSENYPQTQPFAQWFKDILLPLIKTQPWYAPYQIAGDR